MVFIRVFSTLATVALLCNAQQYKSVEELPRDVYRLKLDGLVTTVHEGDNFMFYHVPNGGTVGRVNYRDTMIVRLVGIDAPDSARPGVPGQIFSRHARDRLARLILNKRVTVELFAKDQSGQAVWGSVNLNGENVSVKLVEEGLARVLVDRSAVYGDVRSQLFKAETNAKQQRFGLWGQPGQS